MNDGTTRCISRTVGPPQVSAEGLAAAPSVLTGASFPRRGIVRRAPASTVTDWSSTTTVMASAGPGALATVIAVGVTSTDSECFR
jgi:hypothetical protein